MANPYHDETGKFCSREEMQGAVIRLYESNDPTTAQKLHAELKDLDAQKDRSAGTNFLRKQSTGTAPNAHAEWVDKREKHLADMYRMFDAVDSNSWDPSVKSEEFQTLLGVVEEDASGWAKSSAMRSPNLSAHQKLCVAFRGRTFTKKQADFADSLSPEKWEEQRDNLAFWSGARTETPGLTVAGLQYASANLRSTEETSKFTRDMLNAVGNDRELDVDAVHAISRLPHFSRDAEEEVVTILHRRAFGSHASLASKHVYNVAVREFAKRYDK